MRTFKKFDADKEKMRELILYISEECADQRLFGKTKLNKILYFVDFIAFRNLGQPITGFTYLRAPRGPVPTKIHRELNAMCSDGDLEMTFEHVYFRRQERPEPLRRPRMDRFSSDEIKIVDHWIETLEEMSATDASDLAHELGGWKFAKEWGPIPYETVYLDNRPMTEEDWERGWEVVDKWCLR